MGQDFLRSQQQSDKRRRDRAFERSIKEGDLFVAGPVSAMETFRGTPHVPVHVGQMLYGTVTVSSSGWLSTGATRALAVPLDVSRELCGIFHTRSVVARVVEVDRDNDVCRVEIVAVEPEDAE